MKLTNSIDAWGTPDFETALKQEIQSLDHKLLPLQAGLSQSSHVSDSDIRVLIMNITETTNSLQVKAGIFYAGVIAGSCCADDPTPLSEQTEYCEVQLDINKETAEATVALLQTEQ